MREQLLSLALLVTPNLDEVGVLLGEKPAKDRLGIWRQAVDAAVNDVRRPRTDGFLAGRCYAATAGAFSASYASGER